MDNFFKKAISGVSDFVKAKNYSGWLFNSFGGNYSGWNGKDFLKANEISLYVNKAIEKRAEKIGQTKFILFKGDRQINEHWILDLLAKPNKFHNGQSFWRLCQKYYDLLGKAFIFKDYEKELFNKNTKIKALHLLRPDRVKIQYNEDNTDIDFFIYNNGKREIHYKPEQIVYLFNPDPMSPLEGVSLLKSGVNAIDTEVQIRDYHSNILKNGGKVETVIKFKTPRLTKEQIEELKQGYIDQYAGAKKAGLPMFLGGDSDIVKVGLNPQELAFLEAKGMALEDICILTGVPKVLLASFKDIKFDNADASEAIFQRETIKPLVKNICNTLDEYLVPEEFDLSFIDQTPQDVTQKLSAIKIGYETGTLTPNERRQAMSDIIDGIGGYPDKSADKLYQPFNLMPIGEEKQGKEPAKMKSNFKHPLKDKAFREKYGENVVKQHIKEEEVFRGEIKKFFNKQKERILNNLGAEKSIKKKNLLGEIFDYELEIKMFEGSVLPLIKDLYIRNAGDAMDLVGSDYSFNFGSKAQRWVDERAGILGEGLTETTKNDLSRAIDNTIESGLGRNELVKELDGIYDRYSKTRLELIARTETHAIMNSAKMEGYAQAGVPIKIWVHAGPAMTQSRDWHAAIDGEEREINDYFSIGLKFPGDGPPSESANCRCSI